MGLFQGLYWNKFKNTQKYYEKFFVFYRKTFKEKVI